MSSGILLTTIVVYFLILIAIARVTSKGADNATFFVGNKTASWYVVAFGMIGASLSGVTFMSVPGWVGTSGFTYMQMILGYLIGYVIVAFVLLPLYYRKNLSSIYAYLGERFGPITHLTGACFFLFSRILGASFRLFLVADILDYFVFSAWGIPFWLTVAITLLLIWVYTNKGGIKTIIWTDTLQTIFMLTALVMAIYLIHKAIGNVDLKSSGVGITDWFVTNNPNAGNYWWKHILGGMFVTIAMTGLDQDMMQKNLSCKNTKDAQKNMISLGVVLIAINFVFLLLGTYLYAYIGKDNSLQETFMGMNSSVRSDRLFPLIALKGGLGNTFGIVFILGLIAAAYSSADSALTSLTTSASIDIWKVDKLSNQVKAVKIRKRIHVGMTIILFGVILLLSVYKDGNVISSIFAAASYTYGPLLGLFFFGIFTKRTFNDKIAWIICLIVPTGLFIMKLYQTELFGDYQFGFELLGINGVLCFLGLSLISKRS